MNDGEITGELAKVRAEATRGRRRDGAFYLIVIITAIGSAGIAMLFSYANTNASERKFCAVVSTQVRQAEGRVDTYLKEPPTTAAGLAQESRARADVKIARDLQRSLGCPMRKEEP